MQFDMDSPGPPNAIGTSATTPTGRSRQDMATPLLLFLFLFSGCAALIYEIVWFQLLEFVLGSTAVSLAVILGTFMGGMCVGSLALPRLVPRRCIRCASAHCWSSE